MPLISQFLGNQLAGVNLHVGRPKPNLCFWTQWHVKSDYMNRL